MHAVIAMKDGLPVQYGYTSDTEYNLSDNEGRVLKSVFHIA